VPEGRDARSCLLRSLLAGRRLLLILDNVRDAGQARPLLPGTPGCVVVVTSRNRILGLVAGHGATSVPVAPLAPETARELLVSRLGVARAESDPGAVRALVRATAGLPLALVTLAARAAMRSSLTAVVAELRASRLDGLGGSDEATDPRTVFSWSYRALSPGAARLFRLLSVHRGPDLPVPLASSLAGEPAARTIEELVLASLLTEHRPGRYVLHDLLREYAAMLVEPGEREAARRRMLDHYLHTARAGAMLLDPQRKPLTTGPPADGAEVEPLADEAAAMRWFGAEHANLMAALEHEAGRDAYGWQLPWAMVDFLDRRGYWDDWILAERRAIEAARACGRGSGTADAGSDVHTNRPVRGRRAALRRRS